MACGSLDIIGIWVFVQCLMSNCGES
ncbi:hypothetical protein Gotri_011952 [Gossypium trilobum]|uniref:Uncharacterized protein n=1 Tax=Gossypium trilobum TaxID=34281 RepID=A0A7J9DNT6_9ROSI|nr:hypothetical protein [Gossypium trilobum]